MRERRASPERREQIIQAALEELGKRGLDGLSMGALARRVGLVPSGLYRHFSGKEEILDAVVASIGDRLQGHLQVAGQGGRGPLETLRGLLVAHVSMIRADTGIPRVMFGEVIFGAGGGLHAQGRAVVEGYLAAIQELVIQGQGAGEIRPGLDPETLAVMFLGLIQPLAVLWELTDGAVDVTACARRSWQVFEGAIRAG